MAKENGSQPAAILSQEESDQANRALLNYLNETLREVKKEVASLQGKLSLTYWVIVFLSILVFAVGIVLLLAPAISAYEGRVNVWDSVITGGLGLADLIALFLFRPINQIHQLMGDMSQITLAIGSYQKQAALRLLEADSKDRASIGKAAEYINQAAKDSIGMIQTYFEEEKALI